MCYGFRMSTTPLTAAGADETSCELVRLAINTQRIQVSTVAEWLELSRSSASKRVNGKTPFTAGELTVVAANLGVPVSDLTA